MEIENGLYSFNAIKPPFDLPAITTLNKIDTVISGEIIDPKCYFGAMNPGQGKPHLSCAVRCISGGIMPVVKYSVAGKENYAILLGENGEPVNNSILNVIGLQLKIHGKLAAFHNWQVLYINADLAFTSLAQ